ncbi:M-phase inducer phosphatase 1 isoform X2 [Ambystoma mexicanum]|uniref:M-phase inducer phosphatase 1 isoform X2 n=1 Tax=Ambystoma mexicanum TaxID=8296 RepID=UPI0037E83FB3
MDSHQAAPAWAPRRLSLPASCSPGLSLPVAKALFNSEAAPSVLSPVTNLALTMDQLQGLGSFTLSPCDTPKKRLSVQIGGWQRTVSSDSSDGGLGLDSPLDMKDMEEKFEKALQESGKVLNMKLPMRRINSLPTLLGSSPALKRTHSEDCDVFFSNQDDENKENESFQFKMPSRPASRSNLRIRLLGDVKDPFVIRQNSAPARMFPSVERDEAEIEKCGRVLMPKPSLMSAMNDDEDDGFLELLDCGDFENDTASSGMSSLWTAPLVMRDVKNENELCSQSAKTLGHKPVLKRAERSQEDPPAKSKRRRSMFELTLQEETEPEEKNQRLLCSKSFSHSEIENVLDCDQRDLVGDFSQVYLLPTTDGRHQDLKYITPEMVESVLNGKFQASIDRCLIIDCRYPYEYEGGHIKGAVNLHTEQDVESLLLKKPIIPFEGKRVIIVFHCEFSSERGPRMCRFVREKDRENNEYPALSYPELYILKGGYKEFFLKCQTSCEPQSYRPMHHEDFKEDLRRFRTRSRTWAGEKSKRELYSRLKKL